MNKSILVLVFLLIAAVAAVLAANEPIPTHYDTRDKYPECTTPILDQGNCGSCWAFSATQSLTERFCIHSVTKVLPPPQVLSPQYLTSCDRNNAGCGGGDTVMAYKNIQTNGNDGQECTDYYSGKTGRTNACPTKCDDGTTEISKAHGKGLLYFVNETRDLNSGDPKRNIEIMQREVLANGPISASFVVYRDFLDFFKNNATKTGVYKHTGTSILGGHAIKLIGWGVSEDGTPYWQAVNSWSATWGDNGRFKILRGGNECTIESRKLSAGIPALSSFKQFAATPVKRQTEDSAVLHIEDGAWVSQTTVESDMELIALRALSKVNKLSNSEHELHSISEVRTQVVNGVNYQFNINVVPRSLMNSANVSVQKAQMIVHESALTGSLQANDDNDGLSVKAFVL